MIVKKIDIIGLRQEPGKEFYEADLRLHIADMNGNDVERTHLHCSTRRAAALSGLDTAGQLIAEAKRQIARMPEHILGQRQVSFPDRAPVSYLTAA